MTFVAFVKLLRLSLMTAATLLGLSVMSYDVCRLRFVAYEVSHIMKFVANYDVCHLEALSQYHF